MANRPLIAAACLVALAFPPLAHAQDESRNHLIATGSEGGAYYPIGVALALVTRINLEASHGITMEAIPSNGSVENIGLLRDGTAQFAIMQAQIAAWALNGEQGFEEDGPQDNLRAVTMLWPDVAHFLIQSDLVETGTIDDLTALEGLGFSMGAEGSGTELTNRTLLEAYGLDISTWLLTYLPFNETVQALTEGVIAGAGIPVGLGAESVHSVLLQMGEDVTLLNVTEEQSQRFAGAEGRVDLATIPASTYPGQDFPVTTIAQPNFLAVDSTLPEEDVYMITRTFHENLEYMCELHPAACELALETSTEGLPVPLHPGAERYYREVGVAFPNDETDLESPAEEG